MRLAITALLTTMSLMMSANDTDTNSVGELNILDVRYNYQIYTTDYGQIDCTGVLEVDIEVPSGTNSVIFYRTRQHLTNFTRPVFALSIFNDENLWMDKPFMTINKENISWGTFFKVSTGLEDGTRLYTDLFDINTYISQDDLDLIMEQSGIDDITVSPIALSYENNHLMIDTKEKVYINVVNVTGKTLYTGHVDGCINIPVASPQLLIVQSQTNNSTITQKILCK